MTWPTSCHCSWLKYCQVRRMAKVSLILLANGCLSVCWHEDQLVAGNDPDQTVCKIFWMGWWNLLTWSTHFFLFYWRPLFRKKEWKSLCTYSCILLYILKQIWLKTFRSILYLAFSFQRNFSSKHRLVYIKWASLLVKWEHSVPSLVIR